MSEKKKPYTLASDEKATPVMVYTLTNLSWGDVVTKQLVRVNTYLRTLTPDYVSLFDARTVPVGGQLNQPMSFTELHVRTPQVIAFHLLPPADEPVDYDSAEANRKMEPAIVLVGPFRFEANLRMATITNIAKYVEINTDTYISLYNATASCPLMPGLGTIRAPLVLIRRDVASFAPRM